MEMKIAVSKVDKYGDTDSGDTVEVIERPNGGLSVVLADGQINGKDNKAISTLVTHRVIGHISKGVRDSASIRASASSVFNEFQTVRSAPILMLSALTYKPTLFSSQEIVPFPFS